MKIINIKSRYELNPSHVDYVRSIALNADIYDSEDHGISYLMNEIPVFLLDSRHMPDREKEISDKPSTEWLGFYSHQTPILGGNIPTIGICPERIMGCVKTDEELMILTAKVILHEFAHARMRLHPSSDYLPVDEFYEWMEEPMANLMVINYFRDGVYSRRYGRRSCEVARVTNCVDPASYVKAFIEGQPDNYRLALELYENGIWRWRNWANSKSKIQKKTKEKQDWLNYVKANVGKTDESTLKQLFEALHK